MPLQISSIKPALDLLANQVDILPATGGAVEDLQRPDEDELEDMLINRDSVDITAFAETPSLDALTISFLVEGDCRLLDARTEDNKWLRIQYDETLENEVGWASSKYIEIVKGEMESLSIIEFDQISTESP